MKKQRSGYDEVSTTSETSSLLSEEDSDALDLLSNEVKRYKSKGFGIIVAMLTTASAFWILPEIGRSLWPWLISLGSPEWVYFWTINIFGVFMRVILNMGMWAIYSSRIPFFERYKVTSTPWPWEENYEAWRKLLRKTLERVVLNVGVMAPLLILTEVLTLGVGVRMDMESFPSRGELAWQLIFCMVTEDFTFYWSHRSLHSKLLYPKIHKIHH